MRFADELREINKEAKELSAKRLAKLEAAVEIAIDQISEAIIYAIGCDPLCNSVGIVLVKPKCVNLDSLVEGIMVELALEGFTVVADKNLLTVSWE